MPRITVSRRPGIDHLHTRTREVLQVPRCQGHSAGARDRSDLSVEIIDRPSRPAPVGHDPGELARRRAVERQDAPGEQIQDTSRRRLEAVFAPAVRFDGDAVETQPRSPPS